MSKIVTIPTCMNPYVVIVNHKEYFFKAGETVEVPDEVAEVIESHMDAQHTAPQASGSSNGDSLTTIVDMTLTEAVISRDLDFGKAYRYLEIYCYVPKAEGNTTNNNAVLFLPNKQSDYSFAVSYISLYGVFAKKTFIECFPENLLAYGSGLSSGNGFESANRNTDKFANGLSSVKLKPNTSGEADMMPKGTHIIIRGK